MKYSFYKKYTWKETKPWPNTYISHFIETYDNETSYMKHEK